MSSELEKGSLVGGGAIDALAVAMLRTLLKARDAFYLIVS